MDRYGPVLVSEVLSAGIDTRRDLLYPLLAEACRAEGMEITAIYERCTGNLRRLEGLDEFDNFWNPAYFGLTPDTCPTETTLTENGMHIRIDNAEGAQFILPLISGEVEMICGSIEKCEEIFFLTGGFIADEYTIVPDGGVIELIIK